MKDETRKRSHSPGRFAALLALFSSFLLLPSSFLLADSIFVSTLETKNVTIRDLKNDSLFYEVGGRMSEKSARSVTRLVVNNEAPLNAAEDAFVAEKWDQAVDGYQRTMRTTTKPWIKDWSAMRLINAASKSGRFDAAAAAYIVVLLKNPSGSAASKPVMPDSKSTFLNTAVGDVNTALTDPKLTAEQKRALFGFLIELHQARKDSIAEDAAYDQLLKIPGTDTSDPNARRVLARRKLTAAARALEVKNYRQAMTEIDSSRAVFNDATQQAEALYILAEARYGLAGSDANALKDAGLAYMRVVALAKNEPARPRVVESLLKTAGIMEQIGQPKTAVQLYQQIVAQYPDDPATSAAKTSLDRLKTVN